MLQQIRTAVQFTQVRNPLHNARSSHSSQVMPGHYHRHDRLSGKTNSSQAAEAGHSWLRKQREFFR